MRIAVCLSGQPRLLQQRFEHIKTCLLDPFPSDTFIHFWTDDYLDYESLDKGRRSFDWEKASSLYRPKKALFEPQTDFVPVIEDYLGQLLSKEPSLIASNFPIFSMLYSLWRSKQLKCEYEREKGFVYDYVIRARSDSVFKRPLQSNDFPAPGHITVVCPLEAHLKSSDVSSEGVILNTSFIGDIFSIGSSSDMDLYMDAFFHLPDLKALGYKCVSGEHVFLSNLSKHGLIPVASDITTYETFFQERQGN